MRRLATLLAMAAALVVACGPLPLPKETGWHGSDADVGVTRILHGSLVLEVRGTVVVVDPWYHSGTWFEQSEPIGLLPSALPKADAVLLTQDRGDHYDAEALADLAKRTPRALCPPALATKLRALGFQDVTPLAPWEKTTIDAVTVTATPTSDDPGLVGYVLQSGPASVYVAGDTKPFGELVDVATAFPAPDVALLPVGGRRVLGVLTDMTPEQAAAAVETLQPKTVIPTHYGATTAIPLAWWASDPVGRFRSALKADGLADRLVVLEPGESWHRQVVP